MRIRAVVVEVENSVALFNISYRPSFVVFELLLLQEIGHMNLCLAGLFYLFQKNALLFGSFAPEKLLYFLVRGDLIEDGLSKDALAYFQIIKF